MKHVLRAVARENDALVARWLLLQRGMSAKAVAHHTQGLQRLHDGVHLTTDAPPTPRQLLRAVTLTAPDSYLAFATAAAVWEIRRFAPPLPIIVRPGNGGPRRLDGYVLHRSTAIEHTTFDGVPITTPERTLADMWRRVPTDRERHKMLREGLRRRVTTVVALRRHLDGAPARRAPRGLAALLDRYERLELHRCRSDAEAYAAELIDAARLPHPQINAWRAGEEADLSWDAHRLIIEIDGAGYHEDKAEDARKTAIWRAAGWRVHRVPSDLVFDHPEQFIARVRELLSRP